MYVNKSIKSRDICFEKKKIRQLLELSSPTSVGVTDGYEHWSITEFLCAQVNCDSTIFSDVGVDWIARETFVIIFIIKNIYIPSVKQSENKTAICLARFLFHNQVVVVSLGVCPDCVLMFYVQ